MQKLKHSMLILPGGKSGEVRINGTHVFINDTEVASLKRQPPVLYTPRPAGGVALRPLVTKQQVKPGQAVHHARKRHKAKSRQPRPTGRGALAPGSANAIRAALGKEGIGRVGRIITSAGDPLSGGTHRASGFITGKGGKKIPYGCAFDVSVGGESPDQAQQTARDLRLQGIAAWYRAPGSKDGAAGRGRHIHCVWPGAPTDNAENEQQISSFVQGYKGVANRSNPKDDWYTPTIQPDEISAVAAAYALGGHAEPLSQVNSYDSMHAAPQRKKHKR